MKNNKLFLLIGSAFIAFSTIAVAADSTVGRGLDQITSTASQVKDAANTTQNIISAGTSLQDTTLTTGSVNSAVNSVNSGTSNLDKLLGTNLSGSLKDTTSTVTQATGAIDSATSSIDSIRNTTLSIDSINNSAKAMGQLSGQIDKYLGTSTSGSVGNITGQITGGTGAVQGAFDSVTGVTNEVNAMVGQATGALELIQDPQALMQMALGYISFDKIAQLAMNAAEDALLDLISPPSSGIPVADPTLSVQKGLEEAAKKATAELDQKISKEQQAQVDSIGSRPQTPAQPQSGVKNITPAQTSNPSVNNCPAYMAQFVTAPSNAYNFVRDNLFDEVKKSTLAPPQQNMEKAKNYIISNFYHKDPATLTSEMTKNIINKRAAYLEEVNSNIMTLGVGVGQALLDDAAGISLAPTSGCNNIDDINMNTVIMIALAKQTIADIAMQIRLLELEAITEQNAMPVELLDKPADEPTAQP